jgi:hypothetical protein
MNSRFFNPGVLTLGALTLALVAVASGVRDQSSNPVFERVHAGSGLGSLFGTLAAVMCLGGLVAAGLLRSKSRAS